MVRKMWTRAPAHWLAGAPLNTLALAGAPPEGHGQAPPANQPDDGPRQRPATLATGGHSRRLSALRMPLGARQRKKAPPAPESHSSACAPKLMSRPGQFQFLGTVQAPFSWLASSPDKMQMTRLK